MADIMEHLADSEPQKVDTASSELVPRDPDWVEEQAFPTDDTARRQFSRLARSVGILAAVTVNLRSLTHMFDGTYSALDK